MPCKNFFFGGGGGGGRFQFYYIDTSVLLENTPLVELVIFQFNFQYSTRACWI